MGEKKIRGAVFDGYFKAIKKRWGKKGVEECAEHIGIHPDDINEKKWYPVGYHSKMHQWIGDKGGSEYVTIAGKHGIKNMDFLSYLARFVSVKTLLKKAPKNIGEAYNFGSMDIEVDEENDEALVKIKGVVIDNYSCYGWKGIFIGGMEATKTEGEVEIIDHPDKGEDDCFLKLSWDSSAHLFG